MNIRPLADRVLIKLLQQKKRHLAESLFPIQQKKNL